MVCSIRIVFVSHAAGGPPIAYRGLTQIGPPAFVWRVILREAKGVPIGVGGGGLPVETSTT